MAVEWGKHRHFHLRLTCACFLSPSAISSLLASVTLDLSQYALDIVKGLAGECPDPLLAPRMAPWVWLYLSQSLLKKNEVGDSSV